MAKGGTPKNQTVTNKQEPWAPIQPYLQQIAGDASTLFNKPRSYFPGSTVVPFAGQTRDALSMAEERARAGSPVTGAMQTELTKTLGGGYLDGSPGNPVFRDLAASGMAGDIDAARRMASGGFADPSAGFNASQAAGGITNGETDTLREMAAGGENPRLDAMFDRISGKIGASVDRNMALGGRTGSITHQNVLSDRIGEAANDFYGSAYESDANRRLQAGSTLAGIGESAADRRVSGARAMTDSAQFGDQQKLQALGLAGNLTGQDANIRMGAAQGLNSANDAERSRMIQSMLFGPQAAAQDYADIERLSGVGQEYEAQGGRYLQDSINRFNFDQNDPYERLMQYQQMLMGLGGAGGTGTSTQPLYRQGGGVGGALGGAASGAAAGSTFGPWGTGIGAILGALGGM